MTLYQLIYTSQATVPLAETTLLALLRESRQWNEQQGITGVLLYSHEHFVQVLEGGVTDLTDLYGHLLHDLRHHNVTRLASGPIAARRFAQWSMGFQAVAPAHLDQVKGYFTPDMLALHHQGILSPDALLLDLIESFMTNPQDTVPYFL